MAARKILYLFIVTQVALLCMAIIFVDERIYIDSGYYFMQIVNTKWFHIEHGRIVHIIQELPTILAAHLRVPLKILLYVWSITPIIFVTAIGLYIYRCTSHKVFLLLLIALQTTGKVYSFMNPVIEQYYGALIWVLFYAILLQDNISKSQYILAFTCGIFAITAHPYHFLFCCCMIIFLFLQKVNKNILVLHLVFLVLYIVIKYFYTTEYDSQKIKWIFHPENKTYLSLFSIPHWKSFFGIIVKHFTILIPLFILLFYHLRKNLLLGIYALGVIIGFIVLIQFSYGITQLHAYEEQVMNILPQVLWFLVLITLIINKEKCGYVLYFLAVGAIVQGLYFQYFHMRQFQKIYTQPIHTLIQKAQYKYGQLFTLAKSDADPAFFDRANFDVPFLTLVYSKIAYPKQVSIALLMDNNISLLKDLSPENYIFRNDIVKPKSWLNPIYFHIEGNYFELK